MRPSDFERCLVALGQRKSTYPSHFTNSQPFLLHTFDISLIIRIVVDLLSYEEWRTFEDVLLGASSMSENVLEMTTISTGVAHARAAMLDCDMSLPQFREVERSDRQIGVPADVPQRDREGIPLYD